MKESCFDNLRERFKSRRKKLGLNMPLIARQSGVTAGTLFHFHNGGGIGAENALKLGAWLGMSPSEVFANSSVTSGGSAIENIRFLILEDKNIPERHRLLLLNWFESTYETFAFNGRDDL